MREGMGLVVAQVTNRRVQVQFSKAGQRELRVQGRGPVDRTLSVGGGVPQVACHGSAGQESADPLPGILFQTMS
jgi:hypothetical protein